MTLVQKNENGVATRRCKDSEDMFICFDRIHKHDRQTDGEIQTAGVLGRPRAKMDNIY